MEWNLYHKFYRILFAVLMLAVVLPAAAQPPQLMLSTLYHDGIEVADYWVSEKLDGVRAYWDGRQLISRQGNIYQAPAWFTAGLPVTPLDGELWIGRNRFEKVSGLVRRKVPDEAEWRQIKFMVFDLPAVDATFAERLVRLRRLVSSLNMPWVRVIEQVQVADHAALKARLNRVVAGGGEGLMLHHQNARYHSGRTPDLVKFKPYYDAEARVISHLPGKGKFTGMLGSLLVETEAGIQFRIGSGFSSDERRNPPPISSLITFKFHGVSRKGIPRFASFIRIRKDR